ncbi:MAG: hypothetical protein ABIS84_03275 [Arachnia sp.]
MFWSWVKQHAPWPLTSSGSAPAGPTARRDPAPTVSRPQPEWPNMPPLQRILARPLTPVAPLDSFTGSLTSHQNPSFLAPLRHLLDPSGSSGVVTGLAVARTGAEYAGDARLTVPTAPRRAVPLQRQKTNPLLAGRDDAPPTSSPGDLTAGPPIIRDSPGAEATGGVFSIQRSLPTMTAAAPRRSAMPLIAVRDLPVVASPAHLQRAESDGMSPATEAVHVLESPEGAAPVQRLEATAPLGGFSAAIAALQDAPPALPATPLAQAAPPTRSPAQGRPASQNGGRLHVQRSTSASSADGDATPHKIEQALHPVASRDHLHSSHEEPSGAPETSVLVALEASPDPVIPSTLQRSSRDTLSSGEAPGYAAGFSSTAPRPPSAVATPAATPVAVPLQPLQRMPMVDGDAKRPPGPTHEAPRAPESGGSNAPTHDTSPVDADHAPPSPATPTPVEAFSSAYFPEGADDAAIRHTAAAPAGPTPRPVPAMPVVMRHPTTLQRAGSTCTIGLLGERPPLQPEPTFVGAEPVSSSVQRITHLPPVESNTLPGATIARPQEFRGLGTAPPWAGPVTRTVAEQTVPLQRVSASMASPARDSLRPTPTGPGFTMLDPRPEQPIRRVAPPVSFASMFSATTAEGHRNGADGFTSVQLQHAGADREVPVQAKADAPVATPASELPSPPPPVATDAPAIPAAAASGAKDNMDEMARRLFEPLSARLRAELWLDRERAGLIADVRR